MTISIDKMVSESKGKFVNRPTKTANKRYDKFYIYLPTELVRDSSFPFSEKSDVNILIDGDRLIITMGKS